MIKAGQGVKGADGKKLHVNEKELYVNKGGTNQWFPIYRLAYGQVGNFHITSLPS